jgi:hypothetical protein
LTTEGHRKGVQNRQVHPTTPASFHGRIEQESEKKIIDLVLSPDVCLVQSRLGTGSAYETDNVNFRAINETTKNCRLIATASAGINSGVWRRARLK